MLFFVGFLCLPNRREGGHIVFGVDFDLSMYFVLSVFEKTIFSANTK